MTVAEAANAQSPLNAALKQGSESISEQQSITFVMYVRLVLPIDGYVFWIRADMVSNGALMGALGFNAEPFNAPLDIEIPATTFDVTGSLHYSSERNQGEDENYAINRVVFTSESPVDPLNRIGPSMLWVGTYKDLKFSFGSHALLSQAAGLWHYQGNAVYPDMEPQLIDKLTGFPQTPIVSNSLPLWLAMTGYQAQPWEAFSNTLFSMYPAFLMPANLVPPFAAVNIVDTKPLGSIPVLDLHASPTQLMVDTVKVTLWGGNNQDGLFFQNFINQYCQNIGLFGLLNTPNVTDEKRIQTELGTMAKKKTITFEISYYQSAVNDFVQQYIRTVIPTYYLPVEFSPPGSFTIGVSAMGGFDEFA